MTSTSSIDVVMSELAALRLPLALAAGDYEGYTLVHDVRHRSVGAGRGTGVSDADADAVAYGTCDALPPEVDVYLHGS
jgi:hypothetical protein